MQILVSLQQTYGCILNKKIVNTKVIYLTPCTQFPTVLVRDALKKEHLKENLINAFINSDI